MSGYIDLNPFFEQIEKERQMGGCVNTELLRHGVPPGWRLKVKEEEPIPQWSWSNEQWAEWAGIVTRNSKDVYEPVPPPRQGPSTQRPSDIGAIDTEPKNLDFEENVNKELEILKSWKEKISSVYPAEPENMMVKY